MGVCGIVKIILYDAGVVMCYDQHGYQSISMQGIFNEVVDHINTVIKPNDVKWFYVENGVEKEVSHAEWMKHGANLTKNNVQPEVRDVSAEDLQIASQKITDPDGEVSPLEEPNPLVEPPSFQ